MTVAAMFYYAFTVWRCLLSSSGLKVPSEVGSEAVQCLGPKTKNPEEAKLSLQEEARSQEASYIYLYHCHFISKP